MEIPFDKYQAVGNDFILLDNRQNEFGRLSQGVIARLCDRRFGVGGDGMMMLNSLSGYDFEMKYYNADGAIGSMCGNGGRCITAFAHKCGIGKTEYKFLAYDGDHYAKILANGDVSLKMNPVDNITRVGKAQVLNTGSPHYILNVDNVENVDVYSEGRRIRYSEEYAKNGINVNFVERQNAQTLYVRTYERGVEDETYSCGTGVTAAALASSGEPDGHYEFEIKTKGGELKVSYNKTGRSFDDIWLTGPATFVFSGTVNV